MNRGFFIYVSYPPNTTKLFTLLNIFYFFDILTIYFTFGKEKHYVKSKIKLQ